MSRIGYLVGWLRTSGNAGLVLAHASLLVGAAVLSVLAGHAAWADAGGSVGGGAQRSACRALLGDGVIHDDGQGGAEGS